MLPHSGSLFSFVVTEHTHVSFDFTSFGKTNILSKTEAKYNKTLSWLSKSTREVIALSLDLVVENEATVPHIPCLQGQALLCDGPHY